MVSVREYLATHGAEPAPGLPQRLATALLAATHGVVALSLGTPTMKLPDMRATGRLLVVSLIDAWTDRLAAARTSEGWPRITIGTFA